MSPVELIALSLAASIAVAVVGGLTATAFERLCVDPGLRERVWALAFYLPVLPPVLVGSLLLTPAPVRPVFVLPVQTEVVQTVPVAMADVVPVASGFSVDWGLVAMIALGLAALLIGARGLSLLWRTARLRRLVARAVPATTEAKVVVAEAARALNVPAPGVRATACGSDALLTGLTRPLLILPDALARTPHSPAARAVIAHELAHLKRGDHRAVWLEEAVVALLAANPVLPLIRARRAAAREEACDALALIGAKPSARRAYAQSLIEALRARTDPMLAVPALTFTGTPRSQAMRRLKSILTPPATAGRGVRIAALLSAVTVLSMAVTGSIALAAQREATVLVAEQDDESEAARPASQAAAKAAQDDASSAAQSAARMAARIARSTLSPEQRVRFRNPTAVEYRQICATGAPADEGFCSGVLFANLPYKGMPTTDFCPPIMPDGEFDIEAVATMGRENVVALPVRPSETINGVARAALRAAFPCQAASQLGLSGLTGRQTAVRAAAIASAQANSPAEEAANGLSAPETAVLAADLAVDRANLSAASRNRSISVDQSRKVVPTVVAGPPAGGKVRLSVLLNAGQTPLTLRNGDEVTVVVEGGPWNNSYRQEISTGRTWGIGTISPGVDMELDLASMTLDGRYRVRAEVKDGAGNRLYASLGNVPLTIQQKPFSVAVPLRSIRDRSR